MYEYIYCLYILKINLLFELKFLLLYNNKDKIYKCTIVITQLYIQCKVLN